MTLGVAQRMGLLGGVQCLRVKLGGGVGEALGYDPMRGTREPLDVRGAPDGVLTLSFLLVTPKGLQRRAW